MNVLAGLILALVVLGGLVVMVTGLVLSRRAWQRLGWDELRLVYRGFSWGLIIYVFGSVATPLIGLATNSIGSPDGIRVVTLLFGVASGAAMIAVAVGMYRLARRVATG